MKIIKTKQDLKQNVVKILYLTYNTLFIQNSNKITQHMQKC